MRSDPVWSVRLTNELDAVDERANALAGALNPEQLNWRPANDAWSVGQCLQHLYAANEIYLPAIATALHRRPEAPVRDITPGWFSRWFIRTYIEPSPGGRRARAPRTATPPQQIDAAVLSRVLRSNERARDVVRRASVHDVNQIRFRNPFIPVLRFRVGTGLEILCRHQRRHLRQAERITQAPSFPRSCATNNSGSRKEPA